MGDFNAAAMEKQRGYPPETVAGARAMYGAYFDGPWDGIPGWQQEQWCRAFAAGLQALLPVSDEVVGAMMDAYTKTDFASDPCSAEFTAAIAYLAGGVE